ncbi:hypothetical protein [Rhizobium sullae]|uniref:hypothetical protein n=1 Tax=Rhizobium sullae TaxID=50338 RepID=UPI000B353730|nr:hypothetical protein [Rhizobium sullae]
MIRLACAGAGITFGMESRMDRADSKGVLQTDSRNNRSELPSEYVTDARIERRVEAFFRPGKAATAGATRSG